jgi:hypothetical protein
LTALSPKFQCLLYDNEYIERLLLSTPELATVAMRFFPVSYSEWRRISEYPAVDAILPTSLPISQRHFVRLPHISLDSALVESKIRKVGIFIVIYDGHHSTLSDLQYCLGYYMEWQETKRLVDEHFVVVVGPRQNGSLDNLVPEDEPLEQCWSIIQNQDGKVIASEFLYPNSFEGRKRVRAAIASMKCAGLKA